jgi:hypothetical protein
MRDEQFAACLRTGAAWVADSVSPPSAVAIRGRGDRRRRMHAVVSAVLAFLIGAGGGSCAYVGFDRPAAGVSAAYGQAQAAPAGQGVTSSGRPQLVVVTTGGAVELLNPVTGMATATLVPDQDAIGDEVAVSPDGTTVYFAVRRGCSDFIESVPVAGGTPSMITTGVLPTVSPDGTELAFVREPESGGPDPVPYLCQAAGTMGYTVVIRNLITGAEKSYPSAPGDPAAPVSHLSWAPDGTSLLVSANPPQAITAPSAAAGVLTRLDPARSLHYLVVPTSAAGNPASVGDGAAGPPGYYREGVYLPDGDMFVDRVSDGSSLLLEIAPSGRVVRQVALGFRGQDHTSLDATSGWLLYLSGHDLFVSADGNADGNKARALTSGLIAAAWL